MKIVKILLPLAMIIMMAAAFAGCGTSGGSSSADPQGQNVFSSLEEDETIVDFLDRDLSVVEIEDGNMVDAGYVDYTLSSLNEKECVLDVYTAEYDGAEPKIESYIVPAAVIDDVYKVIDKYKMAEWSDAAKGEPLDGREISCAFLDHDKTLIRVSSDQMPSDGEKAFNELKAVFERYLNDDDRIKMEEE